MTNRGAPGRRADRERGGLTNRRHRPTPTRRRPPSAGSGFVARGADPGIDKIGKTANLGQNVRVARAKPADALRRRNLRIAARRLTGRQRVARPAARGRRRRTVRRVRAGIRAPSGKLVPVGNRVRIGVCVRNVNRAWIADRVPTGDRVPIGDRVRIDNRVRTEGRAPTGVLVRIAVLVLIGSRVPTGVTATSNGHAGPRPMSRNRRSTTTSPVRSFLATRARSCARRRSQQPTSSPATS